MKIEKVIDPVCKMEISKSEAMDTSTYKGKKYYFCSSGCKFLFDKNPEKYVSISKQK